MAQSRFNRGTFVVPAHAHRYISGAQHANSTADASRGDSSQGSHGSHGGGGGKSGSGGERYFSAAHETIMFVLQNEAGAARWPMTRESFDRVVRAFA